MKRDLGFPVFDADNHLYETEDALTRHLPEAHRNLFRFVEIKGRKKLVARGMLTEFIPNPTFEVIARPGAHMDFFSGNNPEGKTLREMTGDPIRCPDSFREPAARLALLDDPDLTVIAIRAFNEWLFDQWRYDYEGRIFTTPVINPCVLDAGIAELELAIDRGAKAVLMRPAPVSGLRGTRSPFLPEFDPFWARVQEAGIVVALHASDSGYQRYIDTWAGTSGEFVAFKPQTFNAVVDAGRTISDALASAICHGMLHRFPAVKLISVENGGGWVPTLLKQLALVHKKMPTEFPEHPVETFKKNIWVNPFWEDSMDGLIDLVGADRVCFGSDYPHAEGLDEPLSWLDQLDGYDAGTVERIASTNMYELLDVAPPS